LGFPIRSV